MSTEIRIRPRRNWFRLDAREVWEYRDLLWLLVRRDFVAKYRQTILGPAWFVIQPVAMTVIFTVVFGQVARIPTDGLPPFLFYLCGMLAWSYFASTMGTISNTFTANAHLFGKVYFPRLVVPLSVAISNGFAWIIQAMTFAGFWVYFRYFTEVGTHLAGPGLGLGLVVLLLVLSGMLAVGVGLWFSSATAKYKDLGHGLGLITQLWLYATPIIYPLSQVPERWRWLAELNPMATIAEGYRWVLLGQGTLSEFGVAWGLGGAATVLVTGIMIFNRVERTFIDTV
ncbi:MAG: ABC transporter permease [Verrucomicrobiia bacterium]